MALWSLRIGLDIGGNLLVGAARDGYMRVVYIRVRVRVRVRFLHLVRLRLLHRRPLLSLLLHLLLLPNDRLALLGGVPLAVDDAGRLGLGLLLALVLGLARWGRARRGGGVCLLIVRVLLTGGLSHQLRLDGGDGERVGLGAARRDCRADNLPLVGSGERSEEDEGDELRVERESESGELGDRLLDALAVSAHGLRGDVSVVALDELRVEDLDQLADRHLAGVGLLELLDELLPDIASVLILPDLEGEGAGEVISDRGECAGVAPGPGLPPHNLMSGGGGGCACRGGGSGRGAR